MCYMFTEPSQQGKLPFANLTASRLQCFHTFLCNPTVKIIYVFKKTNVSLNTPPLKSIFFPIYSTSGLIVEDVRHYIVLAKKFLFEIISKCFLVGQQSLWKNNKTWKMFSMQIVMRNSGDSFPRQFYWNSGVCIT